jgi:hypothetical protein
MDDGERISRGSGPDAEPFVELGTAMFVIPDLLYEEGRLLRDAWVIPWKRHPLGHASRKGQDQSKRQGAVCFHRRRHR